MLRSFCLAFIFAVSSYSASAQPEELLGGRLAGSSGKPAARTAVVPPDALAAARKGMRSHGAVVRYSQAAGALESAPGSRLRGAKEARVYAEASPGVVLIVTESGMGSGVLISADGRILTNAHVVANNSEVGVIFKPVVEGAKIGKADLRFAKVVRVDEVADLALVQVGEVPPQARVLAMGSLGSVPIGSDVHAIGHPTGEAWTYTRGIVSQVRRDYQWETESRLKHSGTVIQTQTPINPGNSGGPLLNDNMEVVGINSFSGEGEGLNYAVSVDDMRAFLARGADRFSERSLRPGEAPPGCEETVLEKWRASKGHADIVLIDLDCDGKGDATAEFPDGKDNPSYVIVDANHDGKPDIIYADVEQDGDFDRALYDTDGDGKLDVEGYFRRGETEPYRIEKVSY